MVGGGASREGTLLVQVVVKGLTPFSLSSSRSAGSAPWSAEPGRGLRGAAGALEGAAQQQERAGILGLSSAYAPTLGVRSG